MTTYMNKIMQKKSPTDIVDYRGHSKRGLYESLSEVKEINDKLSLDESQKKALTSYMTWLDQKIESFET